MLDRVAEFFIFGLVPLVVGVFAVPEMTSAAETTVAGEVVYRERIALPPDAVLVVELADVSLAQAPDSAGRPGADQIRDRLRPQGDPERPDLCAAGAHHGRRAVDVRHRYKPPCRSAGRQAAYDFGEDGALMARQPG